MNTSKYTGNINHKLVSIRTLYEALQMPGHITAPIYPLSDEAIYELSRLEEVLEVHEMHGTFDLLLKIRAKDLNQMREVVENKIRKLTHILETELMTVLKTKKEGQIVSLDNDIVPQKSPFDDLP